MSDHSGRYDHVKCPTCGFPWMEHDPSCCRHPYRPLEAPALIEAVLPPLRNGTASHLPPTISDGINACREVGGGVLTREWPDAEDCITVREWAERVPVPEPPTGTAETKTNNARHDVVTLTEWRYPQ